MAWRQLDLIHRPGQSVPLVWATGARPHRQAYRVLISIGVRSLPITGAARLAGVIGWPVDHSLSPLLHGHWFQRHGIDGAYIPLAVAPEDLELAFKALPRLGFLGWNVTLPHKQAAARLVHRCDETTRRLGAVNTVLVQSDGTLEGRNTDGPGFLANLRQQVPGWRAGEGSALLLGAGGAVRGVAGALLDAGLQALHLVNRTRSRAEEVAAGLRVQYPAVPILVHDWSDRADRLAGIGLLVQCTSLGMAGHAALELALDSLPPDAVVADLVYTPIRTDLLRAADARGNPVVDGLGMLLHQAVPGFAHWGGMTPAADEASRASLLNFLARRESV